MTKEICENCGHEEWHHNNCVEECHHVDCSCKKFKAKEGKFVSLYEKPKNHSPKHKDCIDCGTWEGSDNESLSEEIEMLKEGISDEIDNLREEVKKVKKRNIFLEKRDDDFQRVFEDDRKIFKDQLKQIKHFKEAVKKLKYEAVIMCSDEFNECPGCFILKEIDKIFGKGLQSLSDRRWEYEKNGYHYPEDCVKEFIKDLKKVCNELTDDLVVYNLFKARIDKLAGKGLT